MTGSQTAIGVAAVALVVANQVEHRPLALGKVLGNQGTVTPTASGQLKEIGLEAAAALALVVIAGVGSGGAKIAGLVLLGLWVLFIINVAGHPKAKAPAHTSPTVNGSKSPSQAVLA